MIGETVGRQDMEVRRIGRNAKEDDSGPRHIAVFVNSRSDHVHSKRTWDWAKTNMIRKGDVVTLVTVVPPATPAVPETDDLAPDREGVCTVELSLERKELHSDAEKTLEQLVAGTDRNGWQLETQILQQVGSVGETLVSWLNRHHCDEAIAGATEVHGFKRVMLSLVGGAGSVSKYLANHAPNSVIIVKD